VFHILALVGVDLYICGEILCKCELNGSTGPFSHQVGQPIMHTLTQLYRLFLHQNAVVNLYVNILMEQYFLNLCCNFTAHIKNALLC
jgi:hypothetical protein